MNRYTFWRLLFRILVVAPVSLLWLGFNIRRKQGLPQHGPAILVANHNSHLDLFALLSMFQVSKAPRIRPVVAADYFMSTALTTWLSRRFLGAIRLSRTVKAGAEHPLAECQKALAQGDILILFPEGTRGTPEKMQALKAGIAHLAKAHPGVPVVPVFMAGLGKALPRGSWLPIPVFVDAYIGAPVDGAQAKAEFLHVLAASFEELQAEHGRVAYADDLFTKDFYPICRTPPSFREEV